MTGGAGAGSDDVERLVVLDFVSDQLTDGRRFRILTVVDDCTRSAWRWWPTPRSPASAWRGNWTG
jgi:hypothetical protein